MHLHVFCSGLCIILCVYIAQSIEDGLFKSVKQILTLALKVVYACERYNLCIRMYMYILTYITISVHVMYRGDQLSVADGIVNSLPTTGPVLRYVKNIIQLLSCFCLFGVS